MTHTNLIAHRHQTLRQCIVVLHQQPDRNHQVIDIVKHQSSAFAVCFFGLQEVDRLVAPVPARVEMVRCVVAVVEAVAVALRSCQYVVKVGWWKEEGRTDWYIDQRDARPEVRVRIHLVHKSMLSPVAHHQAETHQHERDP